MPVHRLAAELNCTERLIYYWINYKKTITPGYLAGLSEFFHLPPDTFQNPAPATRASGA